MKNDRGQFLVGGMVFLAALMVVVQAMVYWTKRETRWTTKENRTTAAKGYRSIRAVVTRKNIWGPVVAPSISLNGQGKLYWGPMMATGDITLSGAGNQLYPQKFARGKIAKAALLGGSYASRDTSPT